MSLFVTRTLQTEYGPVETTVTRAEHVSVQGHPVVRTTKFHCHLHFYRQADGTYAVREQDRPNMTRAYVNGMSTAEYIKSAPPTYFAKVLAAYTKAVNDHAKAHPEDFVQAETNDIDNEIAAAKRKVEEAEKALSDAQDVLIALLEKQKAHLLKQVA